MDSNSGVLIKAEDIEKIIKELKEINLLCSEPHLETKIEELQSFVTSIFGVGSRVSVEDLIFEKMVEVKHVNPDLHLKLYMLYRNLVSDRVSEVDAMASFENFLGLFPSDVMIY